MRLEFNWRVLLPLMVGLAVFEALFELPSWHAQDASGFLFAMGWALVGVFILGVFHLLRPALSLSGASGLTLKASAEEEAAQLAKRGQPDTTGPFSKAVGFATDAHLDPGRIIVRYVETAHTRSFGVPDLGSELQLPADDIQSDKWTPEAMQQRLGALAHELGHLRNRDALRSFAMEVAFTWAYLWCLAPLRLIWTHRDLLAAPWNALLQHLLAANTPPEVDGFFRFGVLALGLAVGWRLRNWHKALHHRMETEADEFARDWAGKDAARAALPKQEAAYVFPFPSHPPTQDRWNRLENQFASAGAQRDSIGVLALQHAAFFLAGSLVLLLVLQVRFINEQLRNRASEAVAKVGYVHNNASELEGTLKKLNEEMADAGTHLQRSSTQFIILLDSKKEEILGTRGSLPLLVKDVGNFSTGLSQMRSEAWLGLPTTDGVLPDGGLMQRVVKTSEAAERSLAQAPAALGLLPDGGIATSGPFHTVARGAEQLAGSLTVVSGVVAGHAGILGKPPQCADDPPDEKALASMNLEARLQCLEQLTGKRILVSAELLKLESAALERARSKSKASRPENSEADRDGGTAEGNEPDTTPAPPAPEQPDDGHREEEAVFESGSVQ